MDEPDMENVIMCPLKRRRRNILAQLIGTMAACTVAIAAGMSMGFYRIYYRDANTRATESPAMTIAEWEISYLTLYMIVFMPMGAILSGLLGPCVGRRRLMLIATFFMFVFWLVMCFSYYPWFDVAYLLIGLFTGLCEPCAIMLVAELSEPHRRELMSATVPVATLFGMLAVEMLAIVVHWLTIIYVSAAFCLFSFIVLIFIPESPIWFMWTKSVANADEAFRWYRGWLVEEDPFVPREQLMLPLDSGRVRIFFKLSFLRTFSKLLILFFITCFNGGTAISSSGPIVMNTTFNLPLPLSACWAFHSWIKLVGVAISLLAAYYANIKRIASFSLALASLSLVIVTIYTYGIGFEPLNQQSQRWVPFIFILFSVFMSTIGIKLLPWLLIVYIFPMEMRSLSVSWLIAGFYWFVALENFIFHWLLYHIGAASLYFIYTAINVAGAIGVIFINLEEIQVEPPVNAEEQRRNQNDIPMQMID